MPSSHPDLSETSDRVDAARRLVGWKEIASYLGKADRTVKRWGSERGLPVHRVPGTAKTSVYAYPAELDQWLESAGAFEPDSEPDIEEKPEIAHTPVATVEAAPAPADSPVEAYRVTWSAKRKWLMVLAAGVVFAVALDATARLTVGASAVSVAHRFLAYRSLSVESSRLAVSDLEKGRANEFYLRGRYEWNQRTPESLNRALDFFMQAIVHDPVMHALMLGWRIPTTCCANTPRRRMMMLFHGRLQQRARPWRLTIRFRRHTAPWPLPRCMVRGILRMRIRSFGGPLR